MRIPPPVEVPGARLENSEARGKNYQDFKEADGLLIAQQQHMTALYLERLLSDGLTREELQSGRPIIGTARVHPGS